MGVHDDFPVLLLTGLAMVLPASSVAMASHFLDVV